MILQWMTSPSRLIYPENREILPEPHCLKGSKLQPAEIIFVSGPEQEARSTQEIHKKIHKEVLVMPSFFQTHHLQAKPQL